MVMILVAAVDTEGKGLVSVGKCVPFEVSNDVELEGIRETEGSVVTGTSASSVGDISISLVVVVKSESIVVSDVVKLGFIIVVTSDSVVDVISIAFVEVIKSDSTVVSNVVKFGKKVEPVSHVVDI